MYFGRAVTSRRFEPEARCGGGVGVLAGDILNLGTEVGGGEGVLAYETTGRDQTNLAIDEMIAAGNQDLDNLPED